MHKLCYFLITIIILGSIFTGITVNVKSSIQDDYIYKQQEIQATLNLLLQQLDNYQGIELSEAHYSAILKYLKQAKEKIVLQVEGLRKPIDSKTRMNYMFLNKTNAVLIYICSSLECNKDTWDEKYFSIVVELLKRINNSIEVETYNYSKMNQVLNEMEVFITLL